MLVFGLAGILTIGASSAQAAKGVKKEEHKVEGKVIAVHHHKDGHGSITVEVAHHHKKKGQAPGTTAAPAVPAQARGAHHQDHETFEVNAETRFESVQGKEHKTVGFREVHDGESVTIHARGHHAEVVDIHHHHRKGKA